MRRSVTGSIPRAILAPTQVNTMEPSAPATAARTSILSCWLYLRTEISTAGRTMISAVPCAACWSRPMTKPSKGIASKPPPMPSTPPVNPIRAPESRQPAAMTYHSNRYPSSFGAQTGHGGIDTVDRPYLQPFDRLLRRIRLRNQRNAETQLGGLAQALLAARSRPDLAREPDFAEYDQPLGQRLVAQRGHDGQQHGQVSRRFSDLDTANRVDEDILIERHDARMPVQYRQQHGQACALQPHREPARIRNMRRIDQSLDLDQQGTRSFLGGHDAGARHVLFMLGQKQGRGIGDAAQAAIRHGEDAQFVDRPEAILEGPHQPERRVRVPLEVRHCVD